VVAPGRKKGPQAVRSSTLYMKRKKRAISMTGKGTSAGKKGESVMGKKRIRTKKGYRRRSCQVKKIG